MAGVNIIINLHYSVSFMQRRMLLIITNMKSIGKIRRNELVLTEYTSANKQRGAPQ